MKFRVVQHKVFFRLLGNIFPFCLTKSTHLIYPILAHTQLLELQSWLPILWACDHVFFYALLMFYRELLHTLLTLKLTLEAYQSRFMTELDLTDYKQLMLDVQTFVCNQCFRNFLHCQSIYITTQCAYPTFHKSDVYHISTEIIIIHLTLQTEYSLSIFKMLHASTNVFNTDQVLWE